MFEQSEPQLPVGMTLPRLRFESSREHFRKADRWPLFARFLLLGVLWGIEDYLIASKVASAVQEALEALPEEPVVVAPPIYTEGPLNELTGLPTELRLRAPWVEEKTP
jgi:hypothetical protein